MVPDLKKSLVPLAAGLLAAFFGGCAGQVPPEGGPRDTTPPVVWRTFPDSDAVRVRPDAITLEFSKYVDHRSVEESIFISPYLGELRYDWSGREVTITYKGMLRDNTTYVVNVGTDVVDMRERNRMASAFTLAFATGDSIDRGYVHGRVFDEKPDGIMIFAYRLSGLLPDTLDPSRLKPDYITQTGKDGAFTLAHLAFGPYRIFAIRDEYHNLLYDRQIDQYGVAPADIVLSMREPVVNDQWYRLSREDTSRPFVSGLRALDRHRIRVRFSEQIDSLSLGKSSWTLLDTLSRRTLQLRLVYQDRSDPLIAGILTDTPLDSPAVYRLSVRGVKDIAGNLIDPESPGETFDGTLAPDTLRPSISVAGLKDSALAVSLEPAIEVRFDDPVRLFSLEGGTVLSDSARRAVPSRSFWTGVESFAVIPRTPLMPDAWYTLRVTTDSVRSLTGRPCRDSLFAIHFRTIDLRMTGSISGSVQDAPGEKGQIFLSAAGVNITPPRTVTVRLDTPGPFTIERLPEGKYTLSAYRDSAGSGVYGFGLPAPFHGSDRFTVYPDTIRVRARWAVEGVLVKFK